MSYPRQLPCTRSHGHGNSNTSTELVENEARLRCHEICLEILQCLKKLSAMLEAWGEAMLTFKAVPATTSTVSSPVSIGKNLVSVVADMTPLLIALGTYVTHVSTDSDDNMSSTEIPSKPKGTLLVITSTSIGPFIMGQTLASDVACMTMPVCDHYGDHTL